MTLVHVVGSRAVKDGLSRGSVLGNTALLTRRAKESVMKCMSRSASDLPISLSICFDRNGKTEDLKDIGNTRRCVILMSYFK